VLQFGDAHSSGDSAPSKPSENGEIVLEPELAA
jgi:hypothetical protein